jgi:ribokinase
MKNSIVVVGTLNIDMVVQAPRHPQPGETLLGTAFNTYPGGKGDNQAVAAARLGARVELVGRVGLDGFGMALLEAAAASGVDTRFVQRDPQAPTGVALITLDSAGQNTIIVVPGANGQLSPADLRLAEEAFGRAGIVLLQLELPLALAEAAIDLAGYHATQVILNPSPAGPLPDALLKRVDFLIPNEGELALLAGTKDVDEGVKRLLRRGVRNLVVTLGEKGVLLVHGDQRLRLAAHRVDVVDTVAAGDAFVGAFATALSEGLSPEQACRWGNAAGAVAVTRGGAQPSLPTRQEMEQYLGNV